jgi:hypothetical protein
MQRKAAQYIGIKGMNQDLSISKFSPEFIYYGYNIRLDSVEDNTLMSITNEKGNIQANVSQPILGSCIGYCIIDKYLILFNIIDDKQDCIYRLERVDNPDYHFLVYELYKGSDLNFSRDKLIESFGTKENDEVIKVY